LQDHPKDAEFLKVHLVNYAQMQAIFASGVAMGRFAMGSNEPLGEPPSQDAIDLDTEGDGPAAPSVATDNKNRADASGLGKRKRAALRIRGEAWLLLQRLSRALLVLSRIPSMLRGHQEL